ncbi:hypothetical protein KEJ47_10420 [Candidatus Bathyarchaeota archaeon]|nr:hypothetical protein [Candidatus Bathyarchaeota archaeon]
MSRNPDQVVEGRDKKAAIAIYSLRIVSLAPEVRVPFPRMVIIFYRLSHIALISKGYSNGLCREASFTFSTEAESLL